MYIKKVLVFFLSATFVLLPFQNVYATGKMFVLNPDPVSSGMGDSGVALMSSYATGAILNPASTVGVIEPLLHWRYQMLREISNMIMLVLLS